MKTLTTIPVSINGSMTIRQPRTIRYGLASRRGPLKRFQRFIETTDWDERCLCGRWLDRFCLGGISLAMLYFSLIFLTFLLT